MWAGRLAVIGNRVLIASFVRREDEQRRDLVEIFSNGKTI
jgi:hypothetical protein